MDRNRPLMPFGGGSMMSRFFGGDDPFAQLHREMNRLFDEVARGFGMPAAIGGPGQAMMLSPRVDVKETKKDIEVRAELPGLSDKDVEVTLDDDLLTIRGEKKAEREDKSETYHVTERSFGTFQRSLRLPYRVNPDEVRAAFDNGVLTVTLPKPPEQQRTKRIEVMAGQGATGGAPSPVIDRAAAGSKPGASAQADEVQNSDSGEGSDETEAHPT